MPSVKVVMSTDAQGPCVPAAYGEASEGVLGVLSLMRGTT